MNNKVKSGDYFYTSWGYDQTNIDYLVVTRVSPSGKTAKCRMAKAVCVGTSGVEDVLRPDEPYGEEFTMRVTPNGMLRGSYPFCLGSRRLDTFWRTKPSATHNQTMPQFGH